MTINRASHSFTVNSVSFTNYTDCFINIQKRKEEVVYRASSHSDNVNLAYLQGEEVLSDKNISIVDRSSSLLANRNFTEFEYQKLNSVTGFSIETDSFLVTDIFTEDLRTQESIPLFWQHSVSKELEPGESYIDIKLLDFNLNPVINSTYLVDSGVIYSNLQNTFDSETGIFDFYFVSYSIKKTSGILKKYLEILNNTSVYREASLNDIDLDTGLIIEGTKAYLIEELTGTTFNITLPTAGNYGLSRFSENRIQLLKPTGITVDNPWFARIKNGKFLSSGVTGINKYYISEFLSQSYSPEAPYKLITDTPTRVTSRIIKLTKENVAIDETLELYPEIFVSKEDGTSKFAITSNPDLVGTTVNDITYSNVILGDSTLLGLRTNDSANAIASSSIDKKNGIIVLPVGYEISDTDVIEASYYYEEKEFELSSLDLNPLTASDLTDKRVVYIVRPELIGSTLTNTIYYLTVNEDGLVIDTNIDFTLTGLDITEYVNDLVFYDRDPSTCSWANPSAKDFVDWCTVEGNNNQDDILILGEITIRNSISPNEININDIRVRGGGLADSEIESAASLNSESTWYWDLNSWEGKAFPGAASVYVEVPVDILSSAGGNLTAENVSSIVRNHLALGVYPVIHAYNNYQATVSGINYNNDGTTTIMWAPGPNDAVYDIYLGFNDNFEIIDSGITTNQYVIDFEINTNNQILVLGYKSGESQSYIDGSIFDIETVEV